MDVCPISNRNSGFQTISDFLSDFLISLAHYFYSVKNKRKIFFAHYAHGGIYLIIANRLDLLIYDGGHA